MATLALYLLQTVFSGGTDPAPPKNTNHEYNRAPASEAHRSSGLVVPSFVLAVPKNHFSGVSAPSKTIAEARRSAISDVVKQVLGSVGAQYEHSYADRVSGEVRGPGPKRVVDDELFRVSGGVVLGVEKNIVESSWCRDGLGRYHYFVLVRYPDQMIEEMRRLSKGAKVVVSVVCFDGREAVLRVSETNGVSVVMSSADVRVNKNYRFSKFISFCVWHVPENSVQKVSVALDPVRICGGNCEVRLPLSGCDKDFLDYLLGAKIDRLAVLRGHDELGRAVSAQLVF
ncbi:MAG: hypothetical protein JRL30_19570 [Deltaproteobacteria bacterium]|nr:hypothetical protein [Deltaproteobacteria bacterium]